MICDGGYIGKDTNKIQYVVISGYDTVYEMDGRKLLVNNFAQCLGVYDNHETAYGKAYLYLNELAHDDAENEYTISPLIGTEDTGCKMILSREGDSQTIDWAWILYNDTKETMNGIIK